MRLIMGIIKDRHGTYHARKRVPEHLQESVAQALGTGKARQAWLKRTLGTKSARDANIRAKPVLMEFDRILAKAEALKAETPVRENLSPQDIQRIADWFYAEQLATDEDRRREGDSSDNVFRQVEAQLLEAGVPFETEFSMPAVGGYGMSDRAWSKHRESIEIVLPAAKDALA